MSEFETFSLKFVEKKISEMSSKMNDRLDELEKEMKKTRVMARKLKAFIMDKLIEKEEIK